MVNRSFLVPESGLAGKNDFTTTTIPSSVSPTFTTDDVGKTVESAEGEALGIIESVDDETAYVEPDPGVTDSIKATLDWETRPGDAVPLPDNSVRRVTDDAVELESSFPEESISSAVTEGNETPDDDLGEGEQQNVDDFTEGRSDTADTGAERGFDESEGTGGNDLEESEPMMEDDRYETIDDGPRVVPDDEMSDPDREVEDPDASDPGEASDPREGEEMEPEDERGADREPSPEELDDIEGEASRGLEVDPTELTDDDPEAEITPDEDVGQRTDSS